jgi:hypothetical protein
VSDPVVEPHASPGVVALAEVTGARQLATEQQAHDLAAALYGEENLETLKTLTVQEKQGVVAELMMGGLSMNQASKLVGVTTAMIGRWFSRETQDMQRFMRMAMTKDALVEMPGTWARLKKLRDSENWETARKSILDCMRAAGLNNDSGAMGQQISIQTQNLQFNNLSIADLDQKILDLAERLGPEAVKLVDAEIKGAKPRGATDPQASAGRADGGVPESPRGPAAP